MRFIPAVQSGNEIVGVVEAGGGPIFYARIWEETGHKAFDIEPVSAMALRFIIEGEVLFRKRVHIPAEAARPFMKPALEINTEKIVAALQLTINEVLGA